MKNVRIPLFSGPYSVGMWENKDQKISEYVHFSHGAVASFFAELVIRFSSIFDKIGKA